MADTFKGIVRRPDYLLNFGILRVNIAIDVKSRHFDKDYENFIVNEDVHAIELRHDWLPERFLGEYDAKISKLMKSLAD